MAFAGGCRGRGLRGGRCQPVLLQGLLDSPCGGDTNTLVDLERLRQVHSGFTRVAVLEAGPAESFQGPRFLGESAETACDGQRLSVTLAGLVRS
jgi:hypothetical protein